MCTVGGPPEMWCWNHCIRAFTLNAEAARHRGGSAAIILAQCLFYAAPLMLN